MEAAGAGSSYGGAGVGVVNGWDGSGSEGGSGRNGNIGVAVV